eukprot:TRINITY_DN26060_c2_g1_i1.p3 TRINITY_DN26060_c2_g1~~TRINITY_DN26060_c2_g1_i1.p3  ORF type:complete len:224 (-),score=-18.34 TRINITY_DN26060_c2_g1_i1:982-1653(-)
MQQFARCLIILGQILFLILGIQNEWAFKMTLVSLKLTQSLKVPKKTIQLQQQQQLKKHSQNQIPLQFFQFVNKNTRESLHTKYTHNIVKVYNNVIKISISDTKRQTTIPYQTKQKAYFVKNHQSYQFANLKHTYITHINIQQKINKTLKLCPMGQIVTTNRTGHLRKQVSLIYKILLHKYNTYKYVYYVCLYIFVYMYYQTQIVAYTIPKTCDKYPNQQNITE